MLGVPVPKNIPMKLANVHSSYDLEHIKLQTQKTLVKKVYLSLHQAIKTDIDQVNTSKLAGPTAAPG